MTEWLIAAFFGIALVIGIYFTLVLLRHEVNGRPKLPPTDDFGFAPEIDPVVRPASRASAGPNAQPITHTRH